MAIILGFEVSQGCCSVALSRDDNIIAYNKLSYVSQQAELLIPTIEQTLQEAAMTYDDLNYVATTIGPGSFTGIRIGLATAQGLLLSINAEPIALTNFDTIAYQVSKNIIDFDYIITLINAYRDECYYQIYDSSLQIIQPADIIQNKDIELRTQSLIGSVYCAGSGLLKTFNYIDDMDIKYLPRFLIPNAKILCRTAYQKLLSNKYSSSLNPLYIRKPDAKILISPIVQ